MTAALQNHPAADLFPMMGAEELERLTLSIREQGLIEPIITHEGMILDGRNRAKACGLAGVTPRYTKWDGAGGSPTMFAVSKNLSRRHLTLGQQAAVAVEMLPLLKEEARRRQATAEPGVRGGASLPVKSPEAINETKPTGEARKIAADAVGVGESSVHKAAAIKEADPAAFERIKSGESKVNTEYRRTVKGEDVTKRKTPPPTGKRADVIQNAHYRRVAEAVGSVIGHCGALETLKIEHAAGVSSLGDITQWIKSIETSIAQLRNFKKSLERVKNEHHEKNGSTENTGEGSEDSSFCPAGSASYQAEAH